MITALLQSAIPRRTIPLDVCARRLADRLMFTLVFAATFFLARPATASTTSMDFFGAMEPLYKYPTSSFPSTDYTVAINQMAAAGIKWTRFGPDWGSIQQTGPGVYPTGYNTTLIADIDSIVTQCNAKGINIIFVLNATPNWSSVRTDLGYPDCRRYKPSSWTHWEDYVQTLVTRYNGSSGHGRIQYWEVWNEPDYGNWLDATSETVTDAAIDDFVTLMSTAATKIRAVAGNVVMGTGLAASPSAYGPAYGAGSFFDRVLQRGGATATNAFDIVNYHSYGDVATQLLRYDGIKTVMTTRGIGSRRIWITEAGYSTDGVSSREVTKADYVDQDYLLFRNAPFNSSVDRVLFFQYRNLNVTCSANLSNFGLVDNALVPLPAYYNYQAAGILAPTNGVTTATPAGEGAESDFLLQKTYPSLTPYTLTLPFLVMSSSFDGGHITDYNVSGSQRRIQAGTYMYFDISDDWIYNANDGLDTTVYADVTYLDTGAGNFNIQYDAGAADLYHASSNVLRVNSGSWKTISLPLTGVRFSNGQNFGGDLRLNSGGADLIVSRVALRRVYNPGGVRLQTTDRIKLVTHRVINNPFSEAFNPPATTGGVNCRQIQGNTKYMYFQVSDTLARAGNVNVTLGITFWDVGGDAITVQYNATGTLPYKAAPSIAKINSGGWRTVNVVLTDANFTNAQSYSADFRLGSAGASTQNISLVTVTVSAPTNF